MSDEIKLTPIGRLIDEINLREGKTKLRGTDLRRVAKCLMDVFDCLHVEDLVNFSRERLLSSTELKPDFVKILECYLWDDYKLQLGEPTESDIERFENRESFVYARRVFPVIGCCGFHSEEFLEYYANCKPRLK